MSGILVVCEQENGEVKRASLELVTKAKLMSADIGGSVSALVMFPIEGDAGIGAYGVDTLYTISGDEVNPNNSRVATRIIANAVE